MKGDGDGRIDGRKDVRQRQLAAGPRDAASAVRLQVVIEAGGGRNAGGGAYADEPLGGRDGEGIIAMRRRRRRRRRRIDGDGELGGDGGGRGGEEAEEKLTNGFFLGGRRGPWA